MKRTLIVTACFAVGLLMATSFAAAQEPTAATSGGQVTVGLLNTPTVGSSKFQEYRDIPNGMTVPYLNLFSQSATLDFNMTARNVGRRDQRYTGWANLNWVALSFDYNQTPHNIGNNGHSLWNETAPGVWSMNPMIRQNWSTAIEAVGSSARTWDFYMGMVSPAWGSMNEVDISGDRKRGEFALDFSQKLPFDLKFTYMRELKTGNRGESAGGIYGTVSAVVDVPDRMNEITTDFGINAAYNFGKGNVHASFTRSVYNDRQASLIIDNPFRATDGLYVTTGNGSGGPAQGRFSTPPDNEASRFAVGIQYKLPRQTRIAGDVAFGTWTQNDQYLPYTINSTILTGAGANATLTSALPQQSLNGKINTTMLNFSAASRPIDNLNVRLRYRSFDQANKTPYIAWTGTAGGNGPEQRWYVPTTTPLFATSTIYSYKNAKFDAQAGYDFGRLLSLEAAYHNTKYDRVGVEATEGTDAGTAFSAVFHAADWLGVRAMLDSSKQTAGGFDRAETQYLPVPNSTATYMGLPSNESERKRTRVGFDFEIEPVSSLEVTLAYFRRNDDYPNRPGRNNQPLNSLVDQATTKSGLLSASYDTYTAELDFTPNEKVEVGVFYTYEKNLTSNQWTTLAAGSTTAPLAPIVNNSIQYNGNDKTTSFGANAVFHFVPEKWTFSLMAQHQKLDGFMDVVFMGTNPGTTWGTTVTGSFLTGRATVGGLQPFGDWDDTQITTINAQLEWSVAKEWKIIAGYMHEKYTYSDPYTAGTLPMPYHPLNFLKPDSGNYTAGVSYLKLNYRF
jgi:hypothetical protein